MAKLVLPKGEVLAAMEELGLAAWIPPQARGTRIRITVHKDEVRMKSAAQQRAETPVLQPAEVVRNVGLAVIAASASAWALSHGEARRPGGLARALGALRDLAGDGLERGAGAVRRNGASRGLVAGVVLCGLGALAMLAAVAVGRKRR
jgi:hypothetical protein